MTIAKKTYILRDDVQAGDFVEVNQAVHRILYDENREEFFIAQDNYIIPIYTLDVLGAIFYHLSSCELTSNKAHLVIDKDLDGELTTCRGEAAYLSREDLEAVFPNIDFYTGDEYILTLEKF